MRDYLDFRIDMSARDEDRIQVQATCKAGETRGVFEVDYSPAELAGRLADLRNQNLNPQELLRIGTELGRMLAPGEVGDLLRSVFSSAQPDTGVRLRLVIRNPRLAALPWEYGYVPLGPHERRLGPYLALHPAISIVRHQASPTPGHSLRQPPGQPFRILATSALALPGLPELAAENMAALADLVRGGESGPTLEMITAEDPVTLDALDEHLNERFDLFHFSGHAVRRTLLDGSVVISFVVGDGRGGKRYLNPDQLARRLVTAGVRIAFLNACDPSESDDAERMSTAAALVDAGLPAAVVMQTPVEDSHAVAFAEGFYTALAAGLSFDEAISLGRRRMHELGILMSWGVPVAYSRSPDGVIFAPDEEKDAEAPPGRTVAYRAGRDRRQRDPVEPAVQATIEEFCRLWRPPELRDERTEINAVTMSALPPDGDDHRPHDLLRVLGATYPKPILETELVGMLGLAANAEVAAIRRKANQLLVDRRGEQLSQFSVQTFPAADSKDERVYQLVRLPIAQLLDRSPESHAGLNRDLRLGLSFYDVGRYAESVAQIASMLPALRANPGMLTVPEQALLFYYLSKSLLKLNWYEELHEVLEGPYQKLSHSVLKDLEVERLQVAGLRFRQLGELPAAQSCMDGALSILSWMAKTTRNEPVLLRGFGDGHVLRAQIRLDLAVDVASPHVVRIANVSTADAALQKGQTYFERLRRITRAGNHYEGRLHGTRAFLGVVRSLLEPDTVSAADWAKWEATARGGFEPARDRKVFGIVAGKYAMSVVLLAKARWHSLAERGGGEAAARQAVTESNTLLRSLFEDYLEPARVHIGARFELPKIQLAAESAEELLAAPSLDRELWQRIESRHGIWSPLV